MHIDIRKKNFISISTQFQYEFINKKLWVVSFPLDTTGCCGFADSSDKLDQDSIRGEKDSSKYHTLQLKLLLHCIL